MDHFNALPKKTLKVSNNTYNLELCKWKPLSNQTHNKNKKDLYTFANKKVWHPAIILKNSLYIFYENSKNQKNLTFSSLNLKNNQWRNWSDANTPSNRDCFGLIVHQNQIFLFGGSNNQTHFNDLHIFNTFTCSWKQLQIQNSIVEPRNPMVFLNLKDEYILMCGGVDIQKECVYEDCFLYSNFNEEWIKLKSHTYPHALVDAKAVLCGDRIFMFGGESSSEGSMVELKSFYEIQVDAKGEQAVFKEVVVNSYNRPCSRIGHSLTSISSEYFLLMGGSSVASEQLGNDNFRDIWLFNCLQSKWIRIDPVNGPVKSLSDSSACILDNKIYILGGLSSTCTTNDQIIVLQFAQEELLKSQICSNCIKRAATKEQEEKAFPKNPIISVGFIYNISLEIKHPFHAISMLVECAAYLNATKFTFNIVKTLNDFQYHSIEFDGQTLPKAKFQELIFQSTLNVNAESDFYRFAINLKLGSFRLGKTFIFISADENERKVLMLSADSKITPAFDDIFGYFAYVENIKTGVIMTQEGKNHKKVILNILKSRVKGAEEMLKLINSNNILIFETNILVTTEKIYYYELISQSSDDIWVFKNSKKLEFLDEIGYDLCEDPEISLKSYFSLEYLDKSQSYPQLCINSFENSIKLFGYRQQLNTMMQIEAEKLIQILLLPIPEIEIEANLYQVISPQFINKNFGILLYFQGKLINRLDVSFGDLFKDEFYKSKYKKATTVFDIAGVINIKSGLILNLMRNGFKKNQAYYKFREAIRESLSQYRKEKENQKKNNEGEMEDERRTSKRIKI